MGLKQLLGGGGGGRRQTPPSTSGTIDRVPCPHCGSHVDFRTLQSEQLLDTGHEVSCDECSQIMEVTAIRPVTVVSVRRSTGRRAQQQASAGRRQIPVRQATTLGPAATQRLLRGGR